MDTKSSISRKPYKLHELIKAAYLQKMSPTLQLQQWFQQHAFSILSLLLTLSFWVFLKRRGSSKKPNLPPSPFKLPIIGNLHQLGTLPHRSLQALSKKHGPLMSLQLGRHPALVVSSAEMASEIMKTHDLVFSSRPFSTIASRLMYHEKDVAFAPYGEYWRQIKKICILHLLSAKQVQSFQPVREKEVEIMMEKISQSPSPVNLSEMLMSLTNNIASMVTLGRKYSGVGGKKFREFLGEFLALLGTTHMGDFVPWLAWVSYLSGLDKRVEKHFREWDGFLDEALEEHVDPTKRERERDDDKEDDFVDVLLRLQREDTIGFSLSKDGIKALILDMFAAGTDTSYTVLEWAMAELVRHPEVMKEVQEEVRRIVGRKSKVTEEDIDQMKYLKSVIKEVLRLHPPVPLLVPRESTDDAKLQGYDIPIKTRVIINAWAIGRDPNLWEMPNRFRPDRFMNSNIDYKGHDFQLIPFGAGRRGCPGILFAMTTIELVLANLLHLFEWELSNGENIKDLDMAEATGLTVHKKYALILIAKVHSP